MKRALRWVVSGRPMIRDGYAFTDAVRGRPIYLWLDLCGRCWMAEGRWGWFRIRVPERRGRGPDDMACSIRVLWS